MLGLVPLVTLLATGPTIEWQGSPGCPPMGAIKTRVRAALDDAPAGPPLTVRAQIYAIETGGWRMEMTVAGAEFGESTKPPLLAPSCDELADEFVLRAKQFWLASAPTPASRAPPTISWRARFGGRAGYGLVPDAGFYGGQLAFGLVVRRVRIEVGSGLVGARRPGAPTAGSSTFPGFTALRWTALLRVCGEFPVRSVDFRVCAGAEAGKLHAREAGKMAWDRASPSVDVDVATGLTWWFHPAVGMWLGLTAGRCACKASLKHEGQILTLPPAFGEVALGLEFRWPR